MLDFDDPRMHSRTMPVALRRALRVQSGTSESILPQQPTDINPFSGVRAFTLPPFAWWSFAAPPIDASRRSVGIISAGLGKARRRSRRTRRSLTLRFHLHEVACPRSL